MNAMNFQDEFSPTPIDIFKDHQVAVFDFYSMQEATENCQYPELAGEQLRVG